MHDEQGNLYNSVDNDVNGDFLFRIGEKLFRGCKNGGDGLENNVTGNDGNNLVNDGGTSGSNKGGICGYVFNEGGCSNFVNNIGEVDDSTSEDEISVLVTDDKDKIDNLVKEDITHSYITDGHFTIVDYDPEFREADREIGELLDPKPELFTAIAQ